MFDREVLSQQVLGNEMLIKMIMQTFFEDGPKQMEAVAHAIAAGNPSDLAAACHKLKGSAGSIGAPVVGKIVLEMEHLAKEGHFSQAVALHPQLEQSYADLIAAMQADLERG